MKHKRNTAVYDERDKTVESVTAIPHDRKHNGGGKQDFECKIYRDFLNACSKRVAATRHADASDFDTAQPDVIPRTGTKRFCAGRAQA